MAEDTLPLEFDEPGFAPVPAGAGHYVAAVQNKPGELEALRRASPDTWCKLTPLIEIVGPRKPPVAYRWETIRGWLRRVGEAIGQRPCFLDVLRLDPGHPAVTPAGQRTVLATIHAAARKARLAFVPILPVGIRRDPTYASVVRGAVAADGRGAALRYPLLRVALPPGKSHTSVLAAALLGVGLDVSCADILVDLGYLSGNEDIDASDLIAALEEVVAVGEWRSVVLLGTSMPPMLGGVVAEATIGELPRREWNLWSALRRSQSGRLPTFGDYVIQHPDPPHGDDPGGPSMRANIRYTVNSTTLVARARGAVILEGREQYRGLCQQLVERPEFCGQAFSWGDEQIAACARSEIEPGSQNQWRGAGSSHHLRLVTEQLNR